MSDLQLIRNCAPTLAGIKIANLFSTKERETARIAYWLKRWNGELNDKGVFVRCLRKRSETALIYVYRPKALHARTLQPEAARILDRLAYPEGGIESKLDHLSMHLNQKEDFPHEIGVFLGYPIDDVCAFMEKKGRHYKCSGYWKVYGDEEKAKACFTKYRRCTICYLRRYQNGGTLRQLTV
jgi:hypothetical protein